MLSRLVAVVVVHFLTRFLVSDTYVSLAQTGDDIWLDFDQTKKYAPAKTMSITVSNKDSRAGITKDGRQ